MSTNLDKDIDGFKVCNLEVVKTARYYTYGNENSDTIWFLLHGYGMSAKSMLKMVCELNSENFLFIAPEGLSRFYRSGFSGPIVASWMTKEDRENEIKDYIHYLEKLNATLNPHNKSINVLGFSQGVATASRWIDQSDAAFNKVIFWAGEPAMDIDYRKCKTKLERMKFVVGNDDPFLDHKQITLLKDFFAKTEIPIVFESFEGKHELNQELLFKLL